MPLPKTHTNNEAEYLSGWTGGAIKFVAIIRRKNAITKKFTDKVNSLILLLEKLIRLWIVELSVSAIEEMKFITRQVMPFSQCLAY